MHIGFVDNVFLIFGFGLCWKFETISIEQGPQIFLLTNNNNIKTL